MIWTRACYPILFGYMFAVVYFRFELINTALDETMNQRNVEVIDNTTNTTSPFLYLSKKIMFFTWSISIKCKVLHLCLAYLNKFTLFEFKSSILIFVSHTKLNGIRNDLSDDCRTVLPLTTMEIPWNMIYHWVLSISTGYCPVLLYIVI